MNDPGPHVVAVTGGHDFHEPSLIETCLNHYLVAAKHKPDLLIVASGCGISTYVIDWAKKQGVHYATFHDLWDAFGAAAEPARDRAMLYAGRPNVLLAFPGNEKTSKTVRLARTLGIPVQQPLLTK